MAPKTTAIDVNDHEVSRSSGCIGLLDAMRADRSHATTNSLSRKLNSDDMPVKCIMELSLEAKNNGRPAIWTTITSSVVALRNRNMFASVLITIALQES
jgi:hypothetical protein